MAILVKPILDCNFECDYCYESGIRNSAAPKLDVQKVKDAMISECRKYGTYPTFHGGEITILPRELLRELFQLGYALGGRTAVQTNAFAIDDELIDLFKKYRCGVGVSIDGPWPINKARGKGSLKDRQRQYEVVMGNIRSMVQAGVSVSIISVINANHLVEGAVGQFKQWLLELKELGVISGRMNLVASVEGLDKEKAAQFYKDVADVVLFDSKLLWRPFRDIVDSFLGLGTGSCDMSRCDYFCSQSAVVIHGDGSLSNCLHSAIDGRIKSRREMIGSVRYEILPRLDQSSGGCKDCRYWKVCGGLCPSDAIDSEWENRSTHCEVIRPLFEHIERKLRGLLPNIQLCIDDPQDDFVIRRDKGHLGDYPFQNMLPQYVKTPSSWRHVFRSKSPGPGWEIVGNSCGSGANLVEEG